MDIDIDSFREIYPYKSNYFNLNGMKYHYIDEGQGEPIIMIHGNPTWSFYFRNMIDKLSPYYRTIAVDHIGCGLSDKPNINQYDYRLKSRVDDIEAFIDYLGLKDNITLFVHDWGGMIGMTYALRKIEKIKHIIITNTAAFFPPHEKRLPFRLQIVKNTREFSKIAVLGLNLFAIAALYMAPYKKLSKQVKKGLIAPYNSYANRIATLKFVQDIPLDKKDPSYNLLKFVDENLYKLSEIPMLICWGEHDFVFDMEYFNEWKKRFKKAKVHLFPKAGHYLLEDEPDKVADLVKKFMEANIV